MIFISKKRLHGYITKKISQGLEPYKHMTSPFFSLQKEDQYYLKLIKNYSDHLVYLSSILKYHNIEVPPMKPIEMEDEK